MLSTIPFDGSGLSNSKPLLLHPSLNLKLWDQPLYEFQVEASELGKVVAKSFERNSQLPGVILMEFGQFLGVISRRRFLERLSRPYGLELFLTRPLKTLHRWTKTDPLILPGDTLILEATQMALRRSSSFVYEPIVVELTSGVYRLLDMQQLLMAESQIHQLATHFLHQLYEELQTQASLDGLTQVANRRRFDQYFYQQWEDLQNKFKPFSVILSDVDHFKNYNDTYGHQAGDDCLKKVAQTIAQAVDVKQSLVARYGGEEFIIVLPEIDLSEAIQIAEKIRVAVKDLNIQHQTSPIQDCVTLSLGVGCIVPPNPKENTTLMTPEFLIKMADKALYQAKTLGRNRVAYSR